MNPNPQQIAEERLILSEEYSRLSDELATIDQSLAKSFITRRNEFKSDKACDRAFDATDAGQRRIWLMARCKSIMREMSAKNSYLRVLENQGKNYY